MENNVLLFVFLQMLNVVILLLQVFFKFIPSIWIMFILIVYEGILGGFAYVNTFYRITQEVTSPDVYFKLVSQCRLTLVLYRARSPKRCAGDREFSSRSVQTNDNLYLLLPSLPLGINMIGQGLVSSVSG